MGCERSAVQVGSPRPLIFFKEKPLRKRILLVNDDGIYAEGLRCLKEHLGEIGEVWVVAPESEQSASSHSITLHRPLRVKRLNERIYAVDGTPADCVNLAINGLLGFRPDITVSGINKGPNLGDDITYSGTVSGAMESTLLGVPAFSISVAGKNDINYKPAGKFAVCLTRVIFERGLPRGVFLNVNVPNVKSEGEIKGVSITRQGRRKYGEAIVEKIDPRGQKYYWIGGDELGFEHIEDSDIVMVMKKYISITPLHLDLTYYEFMNTLREWKDELSKF